LHHGWREFLLVDAAEQRGDPGEEFVGIERFYEVIIGAGAEPAHTVAHFATRSKHEDRAVEASLAYRVANLETRFARQHDVEDQEVKVLLNRAAQPEIAIGGDLHHVARGAEKIGDDEDNPGFILDEQNPGVHRAGRHTVKVAPAPGRLVTPMVPP